MYNNNQTNLKEQFKFLVDYWIGKLDNQEELEFFIHYELHSDQLSDYVRESLIKRMVNLKQQNRKQSYTRQRYARDGFYSSDAYKEQAEKIHKTNDERYKIHPMRY